MNRCASVIFSRRTGLVQCVRHIHVSKPLEVKDVEEIRIPVPWGHIAGKWWGHRNTKPLIGLHGWQDNAGTWDTLAPFLQDSDISLLALDGPGHGFSSPFPDGNPYRMTDQLIVLRAVVNHYKWDKISILAHSMGAVQSFIYSSIYPEQVENLMLVDAFKPLSVDPESEINKIAPTIENFLKFEVYDNDSKKGYSYDETVERLFHGMVGKSLTRESCEVLLRRGIEEREEGFVFRRDARLKAGRLGGWPHDFVLHMASKITCNVLIVKAVPGLVFESEKINTETLEAIKKSAKNFEFCTVEGLHHVHLNNPERVAPLIINFFKYGKCGPSDFDSDSLKKLSSGSLNFM